MEQESGARRGALAAVEPPIVALARALCCATACLAEKPFAIVECGKTAHYNIARANMVAASLAASGFAIGPAVKLPPGRVPAPDSSTEGVR